MRQEDLQNLLRRTPCPLIRLYVSGGRTFDNQDPEQAVVTRSTVELLLYGEKEREAIVSLLHVVWVEVVSST